ncbi:MAG TPA: gamma-glutamyl-gamma-aminobutyrate hydrolase family protein, partial [Bacilli bacterium]|nr:gamma-glutamyl-gamma-aminobutyrate hydrolase family protein [Bacilli bacterium]
DCLIGLDEVDRLVVEYAKKHQLPVLGICRGHQAINVFLGGSLHQDVGNNHRNIKDNHKVTTQKNQLLPFEDEILVNSYHHQTVKTLAPKLKAIAYHLDGTIEAFIHEELPIIGIQWHPEIIIDEKESQIIFDKFAELVHQK